MVLKASETCIERHLMSLGISRPWTVDVCKLPKVVQMVVRAELDPQIDRQISGLNNDRE